MYIFIEKRFLFKPFSNETCCHLSAIHLSAIHLFTWVDFWTIRFKNLIISFHLEKSFPQYTPSTNFLLPPPKATQPPPPTPRPPYEITIFMLWGKNNLIFSRSHCSYSIFVLPSHTLHTQVMLILILINAQYLQIVACSFAKCFNDQKHSFSDWKKFEWSKELLLRFQSNHETIPLSAAKFFIPLLTVSSPYSNFWFSHSTPYSSAIWETLDNFQVERITVG